MSPVEAKLPHARMTSPAEFSRTLSLTWMLFAQCALGVAGGAAVLLVLFRTPMLAGWFSAPALFPTALVLHVVFAVLVWFVANAGAVWSMAGGGGWRSLGLGAVVLSVVGAFLMVTAPLFGPASAVLNNYIPVLVSAPFLTGLSLFASGGALLVARALLTLLRPEADAIKTARLAPSGLFAAALVMLLAVVNLGVTFLTIRGTLPAEAFFETLFWGVGHTLQLAHVALMVTVWLLLAEAAGVVLPLSRRVLGFNFALGAAPAFLAPVMPLLLDPHSPESAAYYTHLMTYGSWLPVPVVLGAILWGVAKQQAVKGRTLLMALWGSQLLFGVGLLVGALIRDDSVMVTAHYHGTVGAVTLAYMGMGFLLLAPSGGEIPRWVRLQPALLASGVALLVGGLAWSGHLGVSRKVMLATPLSSTSPEFFGLLLMGVGGAVGLVGVFLYLAWSLPAAFALLQGRRDHVHGRWFFSHGGVVTTLLLIVLVGCGISWMPGAEESLHASRPELHDGGRPAADSGETPDPPELAPIRKRFQDGVVMLHAKQYESAATAFHWVLEHHPAMVEANVNLGYAFIGMKEPLLARDFFLTALELRPTQANAYYGLALAWEGAGDLEQARGAMRSFIHLTRSDDPHLVRARAALWEWEEGAAESGGGASGSGGALNPG